MALQLKRAGVVRVRPLAGGFEAWHRSGYPVEPIADRLAADLRE